MSVCYLRLIQHKTITVPLIEFSDVAHRIRWAPYCSVVRQLQIKWRAQWLTQGYIRLHTVCVEDHVTSLRSQRGWNTLTPILNPSERSLLWCNTYTHTLREHQQDTDCKLVTSTLQIAVKHVEKKIIAIIIAINQSSKLHLYCSFHTG